MGSWYSLTVGDVEVLQGKNYLDTELVIPFQKSDLRRRMDPNGDDRLAFEAPARTVARRLDLLGHSMARARAAFSEGLAEAREEHPGHAWPETLEEWQQGLREASRRVSAAETSGRPTALSLVWETSFLGFPGGGLWEPIRALLDASPELLVSLDLTHLEAGGWIKENAANVVPQRARQPLILLTEGKSDSRILRAVIDVLFPEYAEFIRLMDYEGVKTSGGAPEVVRFVKMFAGCGIPNRIVPLFDNDAAGHDALEQLGGLAPNIFPMCLPSLPSFANYPTEGPEGLGQSNIDGRACALEMYMGRHALTDEHGQSRPVRWTSYIDRACSYQGEVSNKAKVQDAFDASLRAVRENPARRAEFDFSGVEAIFEAIVAAVSVR